MYCRTLLVAVLLIAIATACSTVPVAETPGIVASQTPQEQIPVVPDATATLPLSPSPTTPPVAPTGQRLQAEDLEYVGAFRLPDASGGSGWGYSGQGLTYNPHGDPDGPQDGYPGSLFGFGHDQDMLVSEIDIPAPVLSRDLNALPTARTLQPFQDITTGRFDPQAVDIPVGGVAYLEVQGTPYLFYAFGWHFHEIGDATHGLSGLDLSQPQSAGLWVFGGYTAYVSGDYLFDIPPEWVAANTPGRLLASGRKREGPWSGRGPVLFAVAPPSPTLPPGATLQDLQPLLLYGQQQPGALEIVSDERMQAVGYQDSDHWSGGAWLTAGDKSALIFVGTKALGRSWYGFANGVEWAYDCAEQNPPTCPQVPDWPYDNRGYWAEDYQAQIIFYDPADLAAVARGEMETWEPQPYATLVLDDYLFDPQTHVETYKRDLVAAAAFDRQHGLLFIFERLADEDKSVVHVFRVVP